ncbi:MAG: OmpA family protein [Cyclobacteriaceae bacterium]|nr:OmpA family protein [Cyclobacteriaceae bacterium]
MKKSVFFFLIFYCLILPVNAQVVQWANEIIDFSSELTPIQYSAQQALGQPNVLPVGGESPNAWTPDKASSKEFIMLGFENPIAIKQIAIGESYGPSALTKVLVYDNDGNEYTVNSFEPRPIPLKGRMLNLFFETSYKVAAVKLEFNGVAVPEYYSIDAVAITDSDIPIVAEIEVPDELAVDINVERLSENINSEYKEYKPVLSPDGKIMYFSRKNHPENIGGIDDPEDIWFSEKDENGEWKKAENIGPTLNTAGPNYVSSVTPDGKTAIMLVGNKYLENGGMEAGVSMTSSAGGEWSKPIALDILNDYNMSEKANFYLANSRITLLMSVEREDSYGDRDIYVSFMQEDSTWTEPLNLGDVINTANEESAPFLAADDQTLYFSSNGFSGYGGHDIYVAKRLDDTWTNWSEPQNMGPQINSEFEDVFFNIPASSDYAYYSRGVNEDDTDIFRIELPVFQRPEPVIIVKGRLTNSRTGQPIEARITYERLSDGKELGMITSNPSTGEYEIVLPIGERYGIHAVAEGFIPESQNIDLREYEGNAFEFDQTDLLLVPIATEEVVVLNNVFFDFDQAVLKEDSFAELNRISILLKEQITMEIEVAGHTDNTGPETYNMGLSKRRAESVVQYLSNKGVDGERMSVVYYGEHKPIEKNDTREGRSKNRRVEFTIKKK